MAKIKSRNIYNHCVNHGLDAKRAVTMERGVSRLVDHGFALLDAGALQMKATDLISSLTLYAKLKGLLTDGQNVNNILIKNNMPTLEDIAKTKDKGQLVERAAQLMRELQESGVPTPPRYKDKYPETKAIVQKYLAEKEGPTGQSPESQDGGDSAI